MQNLWQHLPCHSRTDIGASPHEVLTHGQQQEREGDCCDDCSADGEQHLHRVEEEEHDEQGDGGAQGQAHRLQRVEGLDPVGPFRFALLIFAVFVA